MSSSSRSEDAPFEANPFSEAPNLILRCTRVWEDYIEVAWSRLYYDGNKVLAYELVAQGGDFHVKKTLGPDATKFRVAGLPCGQAVQITVRTQIERPATAAESLDGTYWLPPTSVDASTLHPMRLFIASVRADSLHARVEWGMPKGADLDDNGVVPASKFELFITQAGRVLSHDIGRREFPPDSNELIVPGMDQNARFTVKARAVSFYGDIGQWSPITRFLTLPPVNVSVVDVGETEVEVAWGRGDDDDSTMTDSSIEELTLLVELLPSQRELDLDPSARPTRVDAKVFSNEVRRYTAKGLEPGRRYIIRTQYRNTLGVVTEWAETPAATLFPVEQCEIVMVGHDFIHARWQRVEDPATRSLRVMDSANPDDAAAFAFTRPNPNIDVAEWEVRCAVGSVFTTASLPGSETETRLMNLMPGVEYSIDVRAITHNRRAGPWSPAVTASILQSLVPRVTQAGETWLRVDWDRNDKIYKDNIERYHVQISCLSAPFRTAKYFAPTATSHIFSELRPGTSYQIAIQACSDGRWGPWSEAITVPTCALCVPQLVRRGEDFVHVQWSSEYYNRCDVEQTRQTYQVRVRRPPAMDMLQMARHGAAQDGPVAPSEETITEYDRPAVRIGRLPPFSRVEVAVRVFDHSLGGWGDWGPSVSFRALNTVLVLTRVGETFAEVSWTRQPRLLSAISDEQAAHGATDPLAPDPALQYVLKVSTLVVEGDQVRETVRAKHHLDASQPTTFVLTDLEPDTPFSVQLSYLDTREQWSSFSAPLCFRTSPPLRIVVRDVGEDRCVLQWSRGPNGFLAAGEESSDALVASSAGPSTAHGVGGLTFRILVNDLIEENKAMARGEKAAPVEYVVHEQSHLVISLLKPNTGYRVLATCGPKNTTTWGAWSEPVYFFTSPPLELELYLVGQDYAHFEWRRSAQNMQELQSILPYINLRQCSGATAARSAIMASGAGASRQPATAEPAGNTVWYGDDAAVEYELQLFRVDPPEDPRVDPTPRRSALTAVKVGAKEATCRVNELPPQQAIEARVRSQTRSREWGGWSATLAFRTTTPTEIRMVRADAEGVVLGWGSRIAPIDASAAEMRARTAAEADVERYELEVEGLDDRLAISREIPAGDASPTFLLRGLTIGCCYAARIRCFLRSEHAWGQWCEPMYVVLHYVQPQLDEASQQWVRVKWPNRGARTDPRSREQLAILAGGGQTTVRAVGGTATEHTFDGLTPDTRYVAGLLVVEQVPTYDPQEREAQVAALSTRPSEAASTIAMGAAYIMPLVSEDLSFLPTNGLISRTQQVLALTIDRVGPSFVALRWIGAASAAEAAGKNDRGILATTGGRPDMYEVQATVQRNGVGPMQPAMRRYAVGGALSYIVRDLLPNAVMQFAVRTVPQSGSGTSTWSNVCEATLLPPLTLAPPEVSAERTTLDLEALPPVGEDYLALDWGRGAPTGAAAVGVTYDLKVRALDGPNAADAWTTIEGLQTTQHVLRQLTPDTRYELQVRMVTVVTLPQGAIEKIHGSWSDSLTRATLSPLAIAIAGVHECAATVHWRRRASTMNDAAWWERADPASLAAEVSAISKFQICLYEAGSATALREETIGDGLSEFHACAFRLRGLRPGATYEAAVRASTGLQWGAWTRRVTFSTRPAAELKVVALGESYMTVQWQRAETGASADVISYAFPEAWSVICKGVGSCATHGPFAYRVPVAGNLDIPQPVALRCLTPNLALSIVARPHYAHGEHGPWTEAAYAVTLAPLATETLTVGETFAVVAWEREEQLTITAAVAERGIESVDQNIRQLEARRAELQARLSQMNDGGAAPLRLEDMMAGDDADADMLDSSDLARAVEQLDVQLRALAKRRDEAGELSRMHAAELEAKTVYPSGDAAKVDVVWRVADHARDAPNAPAVGAIALRRRLAGDDSPWRQEGLAPDAVYDVSLRSLVVPQEACVAQHVWPAGAQEATPAEDEDCCDSIPWGLWTRALRVTTLKPIVLSLRATGSESAAVCWDMGVSAGAKARTAISAVLVRVVDAATDATAVEYTETDARVRSHVLHGLRPDSLFSVCARVCYDGDRWGVWSESVRFLTPPALMSKLVRIDADVAEVLLWRGASIYDDTLPAGIVVLRPDVTLHRLSVNDAPCPDTFQIEAGTSTRLTMDALAVDAPYTLSVSDHVVDSEWQQYRHVLEFESLPRIPERPHLTARDGQRVTLSWQHTPSLPHRRYIFCLERAIVEASLQPGGVRGGAKSGGRSKSGTRTAARAAAFEPLGYCDRASITVELPVGVPIETYLFRVRVCKAHQTLDGVALPPAALEADAAGVMLAMDGSRMCWSGESPAARLRTPSVPDTPEGLHIRNLSHCSAVLCWDAPVNAAQHGVVTYRVLLNNNYADRFVCVGRTEDTSHLLSDLIPNCHYRASVVAESSMGASKQNHVLHFSTHVAPLVDKTATGESAAKRLRALVNPMPTSSSLRARHALPAPPESFMKARAAKTAFLPTTLQDVGDALLDPRPIAANLGAQPSERPASVPLVVTMKNIPIPSAALRQPRSLPPLTSVTPSPSKADILARLTKRSVSPAATM